MVDLAENIGTETFDKIEPEGDSNARTKVGRINHHKLSFIVLITSKVI